jgi:hypothetical protein
MDASETRDKIMGSLHASLHASLLAFGRAGAATVLAGFCAFALADVPNGIVSSPLDLIAQVRDVHNPGGTVFSDNHSVAGAMPSPKQSAEYLYLAPMGANFSGHSTNIHPAFASALSESDGNGGVGVSSWIAGSAVPGTPATDALVAQAIWGQTFTYVGSIDARISFHFEIPALTVGLIGVAPNRNSVSKAESAQTLVTLTSFVTHTDGTRTNAGRFEYGMRADEYQILLGPGVFANFADITITNDIFPNSLTFSGNHFNPEWTLAQVKGDLTLATLAPGESLTYEYTLTATGTTLGGEHGYYAFVGDPFGVDIVVGNLFPTATPVPEPAPVSLLLAGLAVLSWLATQRRVAGRRGPGDRYSRGAQPGGTQV